MAVASAIPTASTCLEIIMDAMVDAGYLGEGDEPNSEELATHMRRLNKYVNYIQARYGLKLWVQEDYSLTMTQGQSLYTFGANGTQVMAKPRRIIEAYYADSNQNRRPIIMMSRNEWDTLSTITTQGTTTAIFVDKQLLTVNVNVWLVPNATAVAGRLHLIIDQQVPNFAAVNDQMAFPPEWALVLEWGLADQISSGQPQSIIELCKANAEKYLSELEDWDVEDASTVMQPDQRGQYVGRRFAR